MDSNRLEQARSRACEAGEQTSARHAAINEHQERHGGEPLKRFYTAMSIVQDSLAAYEASLGDREPTSTPTLRTITYEEIGAALDTAYEQFTGSYNARFRPQGVTFTEADRARFREILGAVVEQMVTQAQEYRTNGN